MMTGAVTTVAAFFLLLLASSKDEPASGQAFRVADGPAERRNTIGSGGEIEARSVVAANYIAPEYTSDPARVDEFRLEADRSEEISPAQLGWQPTLIDMDLSDAALETYLNCSVHIREPCWYDIDYVIDVSEPGVGQIVFGRLAMERAYSKECEQYAKCTIKGTVGTSVVLPREIDKTFARRKSQTDSNNPYQSADDLEAELKMLEDAVEQLEQQGPDGQPDWEYNLAVLQSVITVIKWKLAARGRD